MADFAAHPGKYPQTLRAAGTRKADRSQSNKAGPAKRPHDTGDVIYAMALLGALHPARVGTRLAVDFLVERTQASLVQAAQRSLHNRLGYTTWHAAQVYDCHPAARLIRVPAATAPSISRLLCSFPGRPPCGLFRVARKQTLRPGLRPRVKPNPNPPRRWGVDPDLDAAIESRRDTHHRLARRAHIPWIERDYRDRRTRYRGSGGGAGGTKTSGKFDRCNLIAAAASNPGRHV